MNLVLLWTTHLFLDFLIGIWPIYKTMSGLNVASAGILISIAALIGESSQIIFGFFADQRGKKPFIIFGLILASSVLLVPYTQSTLTLFLCLLMLYIGSGAYHPSAAGLATLMWPEQKGFMMTIFTSGGQMGLAISQIFFVWAYVRLNGHTIALIFPILIGLFVFHLIHKEQKPDTKIAKKKFQLKELFAPFKNSKKNILTLYVCQVANQMVVYGLIFLLPEFLKEKQLPTFLIYGGGHFFLIAGSGVCMLLAGLLSDRVGEKRMILFCSSFAFIGFYVLLGFMPNGFISGAMSLFVLGGFLGSLNPLFVSFGHKVYPHHLGVVSAILMGFAWCLSTSSFALGGMLANAFGTLSALQIMGLFNLIPLVLFSAVKLPELKKA